MQHVRTAGFMGATIVALCAGLALGQSETAPKPADGDALRGPAVKEGPKTISLVKRDMTGKLERLDTRPEQAALDLLGLTADQRKGPDKVLSDRYAAVTKLLQAHQDLFLKIQQGRQAGAKPDELRPQMREMREHAAPLLENPLQDQVSLALPDDKRAEFRMIVDEYKRASAAEEPGGFGQGAGKGGGGGRGRGQTEPEGQDGDAMVKPKATPKASAAEPIPPRVEMNLLLREMARALNAIVVERKEHMDSFLKAVDATPEQEAQIRAVVRSATDKGDTKPTGAREPTPDERRANWEKIMALLTPDQRRKAMEFRRAN